MTVLIATTQLKPFTLVGPWLSRLIRKLSRSVRLQFFSVSACSNCRNCGNPALIALRTTLLQFLHFLQALPSTASAEGCSSSRLSTRPRPANCLLIDSVPTLAPEPMRCQRRLSSQWSSSPDHGVARNSDRPAHPPLATGPQQAIHQSGNPMAHSTETVVASPLPGPAGRSPAAERMRRHRQRKKDGLRSLTIELREREVDALIRKGLLKPETRNVTYDVQMALYAFLEATLGAKR